MAVSRRTLMIAATSLPLVATARPVRAAIAHYPLHCDPELRAALEAAALAFLAASDIRVHVLPTSDGLLVPQVAHVTQSDIVMTRPETVAGLEAIGHTVQGAPHPRFAGRLVLAGLLETPDEAARGGPIAAPDKLPNQAFDSAAVLAAIGLDRALTMGTVDTANAAFLVTSGKARAGLVYLSDVKADPRLKIVTEIPAAAAPPVIYIATTTQTPRRPQPEAFVSYLASPAGAAIMKQYGLELMA